MTRLLLINPNTSARSTDMMVAVARHFLPSTAVIEGVSAERGVGMILDETGLAAAAEEVVRLGQARAAEFDGVVVAAFGNPGAERLRGLLPIPVVGIGEAAMREAASDGRRFGIATTTPNLVRAIEADVRALGLEAAFTGVRVPRGAARGLAAAPSEPGAALAPAAPAAFIG